MGLDMKTIFDTAADLLPGGTLLKSIIKGAGALLLKKAAKKVGISDATVDSIFKEAENIAETDIEMKEILLKEESGRREFELAFYGKASELSPKAQLWRTITRPLLSFSMVGLFVLGVLIQYVQQIGGWSLLVVPDQVVEVTKWVVGFWFGGRSIEKIVQTFNNKK